MKKPVFVQVIFLLNFIVGTFLSNAPFALAAPRKFCSEILSGNWQKTEAGIFVKANSDPTSDLISYFNQLVDRQMIGDLELSRLIEGLKNNQLKNPISKEQAKIDSALQIQREAIEEYFETTVLDKTKILDWAKNALQEKNHVRVKRDETRIGTTDIYQKIELHPVPDGIFLMGNDPCKVEVRLTNSFEAMSTPVTQKQWVEIMGENPSHFVKGEHTITIFVNGKPVLMQPDNPVENITWWSAVVFANKLSEKHGFPPAYDLSGVKFNVTTRAEDGTLNAESGEVKNFAPDSNIYQAQGYRLPTEAEQEYLLRAAGKANGKYYFGEVKKDLRDHAWYRENAMESTQPVAGKKSLIIKGKEFFDLHGNVSEWGNDRYDLNNRKLIGGKNPTGLKSGPIRVMRGGSWFNSEVFLRSAYRNGYSPFIRNKSVGLRLVRSMK